MFRVWMGIGIVLLVEELLLFLFVTRSLIITQFPFPSMLCTIRTYSIQLTRERNWMGAAGEYKVITKPYWPHY